MTIVFILLWVAISAVILGTFFWSTIILQKQKKAWAEFAKRHKLTYEGNAFMESPTVSGIMRGANVTITSVLLDPDDMKARRYVSMIIINTQEGFAGGGAAGTSYWDPMIQELSALQPVRLESSHWSENVKFYARDEAVARIYLDNARMRHLNAIMTLKNAEVLVMYDEREAEVRVMTSDPIQDIEKAEKVINHIFKHLEPLMIDKKKRKAIMDQAKENATETESA